MKTVTARRGEKGYMLLAVMLLVILMMVGLALEAPRIGQQIKREREEELIHRGNEYKNAIRRYFRKFGNYPVSIDQLQNTNNMRFLRKRFVDPFTGKDDWHLLRPGEVQLNPANGGVNGVSGQQPGQAIGAGGPITGSAFGQSPAFTPTATPSPTPQATSDQNSSGATPGTGTNGLTPASNMPGATGNSPVVGGGPVVGVSSTSKLQSIKIFNGKDHYNDWQFVYDPRLEVVTTNPGAGTPGVAPVGGTTPGGATPGGTMPGGTMPGQTGPQPAPSPPMNQ